MPTTTIATDAATTGLESRLAAIGHRLSEALGDVIAAVPGSPRGPQDLATALGLDKVLASRVLKSIRAGDPMAVVHYAPGPEPMRRLVRAAARRGVDATLIDEAKRAIDAFEQLIRRDLGDRSALDAIISAWLPEARREFELRRKQAQFRAMSQLKGAAAETCLSTVILNPSDDGRNLDIVWVIGYLGLQRLRPGTAVKCTSRRIAPADAPRLPRTLTGGTTEDIAAYRLDEFCQAPPAPIERRPAGETIHYVLAGNGFGPGSETDLLIAEANLAEMPRYVPAGSGRRGYVFAEIATPSKRLLFDCFVHDDVYPGRDPQLVIHDTAYEGVASLNDRARDADRLDMMESIQHLGRGTGAARDAALPQHVQLLRHVFTSMGWDDSRFRGYRCSIDYPVYGSQVSMAFDPPSLER
jgi:hypothetical protein